jgi:hypothetical protein
MIGSPTTRDSAIGSPTTHDLATGLVLVLALWKRKLISHWKQESVSHLPFPLARLEAENRKFRQDWLSGMRGLGRACSTRSQ